MTMVLNYLLRLIIGMIHRSFDKFMLTNQSGLLSVGYYSIGEKFASILKIIIDAVNKVWTPFFLEHAHINTEESKREIIKRYFEISFYMMFIGFLIIFTKLNMSYVTLSFICRSLGDLYFI